MRDLTEYTTQELNEFWSTLMIKIHQEFCEHQQNYDMWAAGMAVIQEIGGHYAAKRD